MKCCFCGVELFGTLNEKYCSNRECEHYMRTVPTAIWQALIDGKKAQDALKVAIDIAHKLYDEIRYNNCIENTPISDEVMRFANEQIQKITSITKGQDNE